MLEGSKSPHPGAGSRGGQQPYKWVFDGDAIDTSAVLHVLGQQPRAARRLCAPEDEAVPKTESVQPVELDRFHDVLHVDDNHRHGGKDFDLLL